MDLRGRLIVAAVALSAAACRKAPPPPAPVASAEAPPPQPPPVDALLPLELPEGEERAFGVRLPRNTVVDRRFDDSVFAYGAYSPEEAAKYFVRHFDNAKFEPSFTRTVIIGRPRVGLNQPLLRVEVFTSGGNAHLVVRDVTPPVAEANLTDEERWRRAGIGKDGRSTVNE